jgi:NAD(P) transhydrogenase subunit alpha
MIEAMRPGSLIIDLAAATGGNTPFTENDRMVEQGPVRIIGNSNLAASMPSDASKLYGKNIQNFLQLLIGTDGELNFNWNDELVTGACITHDGKLVHPRLAV